ncbi:hypothetical protein CTAYLR_000107 [Chrysophaeum taylorii]|uniref:Phytanoyl-CoA dioxygenase n=1 Tax=Chrysophaeum taylorii TaxID=2483200 RepID=A0AAD7UIW9_9STRA|nr:hypothetical protein CTAYLR_000107 [Chrysophaeum taylorii]
MVRSFVERGFVVIDGVSSEFPLSFHENLGAKLESAMNSNSSSEMRVATSNNVGAVFPEAARAVRQAAGHFLRKILGPSFVLHAHRHVHWSAAGRDQLWHKDAYWTRARLRSHRSRWAIAMYYPRGATEAMGPTYVMPGSQYHTIDKRWPTLVDRLGVGNCRADRYCDEAAERQRRLDEDTRLLYPELVDRRGVPIVVEPGAIVVLHFDLLHRGSSAEPGARPRPLVKFIFGRTREPERFSGADNMAVGDAYAYLAGEKLAVADAPPVADAAAILRARNASEVRRLEAAFSLAAARGHAIKTLLDGVLRPGLPEAARRAASSGLAAVGGAAAEALASAETPKDPVSRWYATRTLGEIATTKTGFEALVRALESRDDDVLRSTAAEALGVALQRECFGVYVDKLVRAIPDHPVESDGAAASGKRDQVGQAAAFALLGLLENPRTRRCVRPRAIGTKCRGIVARADVNDRYVVATCFDILASLARDDPALEKDLFTALLDSRWCERTNFGAKQLRHFL